MSEEPLSQIPKVIYLCHAHKHNINKYDLWKTLNPDYDIQLFGNQECIDFLQEEFGQLHVDIFNYIRDGPIKADFWRACIIYKYGGVYADADIYPIVPISEFLEPEIEFLTCNDYLKQTTNPHLLISKAGSPIIKYCIDMYITYYTTKQRYEYWHWSITRFMHNAFKAELGVVVRDEGIYCNKYQIISEIWPRGGNLHNVFCSYKGVRVLMNRAPPDNFVSIDKPHLLSSKYKTVGPYKVVSFFRK